LKLINNEFHKAETNEKKLNQTKNYFIFLLSTFIPNKHKKNKNNKKKKKTEAKILILS